MKIEIKESWNEITLADFLEINKVNESEEFKDTVVAKRIKLISVVSNASYKQLMSIDSDTLEKLIESTKFLDTIPEENKDKVFKIEGMEHMIIQDFNKLTAGESISLEQVLLNKDEKGADIISDILSILIRPCTNGVINRFDENLIEERKQLFLRALTVPDFMGFLTAILVGATSLESLIQRFSTVK